MSSTLAAHIACKARPMPAISSSCLRIHATHAGLHTAPGHPSYKQLPQKGLGLKRVPKQDDEQAWHASCQAQSHCMHPPHAAFTVGAGGGGGGGREANRERSAHMWHKGAFIYGGK